MGNTIKISSFDVDAIKVGSASVKAVYVGDYKVWPNNYFTIKSLVNNNTITLKNASTVGITNFDYSTDNGVNWASFTLSNGSTKTIATINSGETIMMKATSMNMRLGNNYNAGHNFRATGDYEVKGNIMSLLTGNATDTEFSGGSYNFAMLFSGDTHLISAENLIIPASAITSNAFNGTFRACTNLTKAPELPATTLANACYSSMFEGCISLSKPPSILTATAFETNCYQRMFCMSRTSNVSSQMKYTPKMYGNYNTVAFAPQMFCGNGSLELVECYITKTEGDFSQTNWMQYTNSTGTFKKLSNQTFVSGANGIPSGWTIENV